MTIRIGSTTLWGSADYVNEIAPGITMVGTPSHGGIHLEPERNAKVPVALRTSNAWYEEDCEANVVFAVFFDELAGALRGPADQARNRIHDQLAYWFPAKHASAYPAEAAARAGRETSDDVMARLKAGAAAKNAAAGR